MDYNYPIKRDETLGTALQLLDRTRPSLHEQHLRYTLTIEGDRASLTQHIMGNTAILMQVAEQLIAEDPNTAGALKEVMAAYINASKDSIEDYGVPPGQKLRRQRKKHRFPTY